MKKNIFLGIFFFLSYTLFASKRIGAAQIKAPKKKNSSTVSTKYPKLSKSVEEVYDGFVYFLDDSMKVEAEALRRSIYFQFHYTDQLKWGDPELSKLENFIKEKFPPKNNNSTNYIDKKKLLKSYSKKELYPLIKKELEKEEIDTPKRSIEKAILVKDGDILQDISTYTFPSDIVFCGPPLLFNEKSVILHGRFEKKEGYFISMHQFPLLDPIKAYTAYIKDKNITQVGLLPQKEVLHMVWVTRDGGLYKERLRLKNCGKEKKQNIFPEKIPTKYNQKAKNNAFYSHQSMNNGKNQIVFLTIQQIVLSLNATQANPRITVYAIPCKEYLPKKIDIPSEDRLLILACKEPSGDEKGFDSKLYIYKIGNSCSVKSIDNLFSRLPYNPSFYFTPKYIIADMERFPDNYESKGKPTMRIYHRMNRKEVKISSSKYFRSNKYPWYSEQKKLCDDRGNTIITSIIPLDDQARTFLVRKKTLRMHRCDYFHQCLITPEEDGSVSLVRDENFITMKQAKEISTDQKKKRKPVLEVYPIAPCYILCFHIPFIALKNILHQ